MKKLPQKLLKNTTIFHQNGSLSGPTCRIVDQQTLVYEQTWFSLSSLSKFVLFLKEILDFILK